MTPSAPGRLTGEYMAWIQTHSGKRIDPFRMVVGDIEVRDIAMALSNQARFNGHFGFFSVAQHAVLVSVYQEMVGCAKSVQFWGLHHDDAKAYLGDMPSPLKKHPQMQFFRDAEHAVLRLIAMKFNLGELPASRWYHDKVLLATEQQALIGTPLDEWKLGVEADERIEVKPLPPGRAYSLYLERHLELGGEF